MPTEVDISTTAGELRVAIGRLIRRLRAERDFSISHTAVLGRLDREGARTVSALALAERVRPQSMAQTVAELGEEQLVTRRPDPDDRRQTLIELSELGRETLKRERARGDDWLARAIDEGLSPSEQRMLARAVPLLTRLAEL
jgi:DNA-binding MarR family transcriptional regulator